MSPSSDIDGGTGKTRDSGCNDDCILRNVIIQSAGTLDIADRGLLISIISRMPLPVLLVGRGLDVTYMNPAAESLRCGGTGMSCHQLFAGGMARCERCVVEEAFEQSGAGPDNLATGHASFVGVSVTPVRYGPDGTSECIVAGGLLGEHACSKQKIDMLSMLSHDIKNPLSVLAVGADVLFEHGDDACGDIKSALQMLLIAANNATVLLDDLVTISCIENGGIKIVPIPVPLSYLVENSILSVKHLAEYGNAAIRTDIPDGLPMLMVDVDRFGRVLTNILSNSLTHSHKGVNIHINGRMDEEKHGMVVVEITDDGPGMRTVEMDGQSVSGLRSLRYKRSKGHGFGLMVVKTMTELHGGSVEVCNFDGGGSMVRLKLPISPSTR